MSVCGFFKHISALNESLIISRHRWRTLVPFDLTVGSNAAHLPRFGDGQSWSQCNFKAPRGGGWDTLVICSNRKMTADPPKFLLKALEHTSTFARKKCSTEYWSTPGLVRFLQEKAHMAYASFLDHIRKLLCTVGIMLQEAGFCGSYVESLNCSKRKQRKGGRFNVAF